MAKLSVLPSQDIIDGFKGKIDFYRWGSHTVARRWPRSPGHKRSPAVEAQWGTFTDAAKLFSYLGSPVQEAYRKLAEDTDLTAKDWFVRSYISGLDIEDIGGEETMYQSARVYHDAAQSIPNNAWTTLAFNSQRWDNDQIHDTVVNNSHLTCRTPGKYLIIGQIRYAAGAAGDRLLRIRLNGATDIALVAHYQPLNYIPWMVITTLYDLALNDYVELGTYQASGAALNVTSNPNYSPEFMMQRQGA